MRLLLDTHIALWAVIDSPRLPPTARGLIVDPSNEVWVSAVTVWEIAIKHALGRETMPVSGKEALHWFGVSGYRDLGITSRHAAAVEELPRIHADPFDRLLVAQAHVEPLRLITHDQTVAQYSPLAILV
ncbi:MAG: type II toxin-antitoxin system VapC family toxin [Spirochaetaceae bacterium]